MVVVRNGLKYPVFCPTLPDAEELRDGLARILKSGRVTVGEEVREFEREVCERTGAGNAIAVSSGTSGLMLLIKALGLPQGSEVITPSFTFAATSHALLWNGLRPVFCDSDRHSFTMDPSCIEELITPNTSAIYPVCVFGVPGEIDAYQKIAEKYRLELLFDSAQGLGSTYEGTPSGSFGSGEVFSLSPTKVVTAMEGGLITTNDDTMAERVRYMRDYGKAPDGEDMSQLGLSARMEEVNALVGRWSLAHLDESLENRRAIISHYRERLGELPGISFQHVPSTCTTSMNYIVILIDSSSSRLTRDELHTGLMDEGIQTKRYFYPAVHNQTLYRNHGLGRSGQCPVAEYISARSLALPMYSHMSMETVDVICDHIVRRLT